MATEPNETESSPPGGFVIQWRNGGRMKIAGGVLAGLLAMGGTTWGSARAAVADIVEDEVSVELDARSDSVANAIREEVRAEFRARTAPGNPDSLVKRYELDIALERIEKELAIKNKELEAIRDILERMEDRREER